MAEDVVEHMVREQCGHWSVPILGFADVNDWNDAPFEPWIPKEYRPSAIMPEARSVIVIGLPVTLPILETAPSIWYRELYKNVNSILDQFAYLLSVRLESMGYPSMYLPRDGYGSIAIIKDDPKTFFSHRHAAYLAGLGTFGFNNMLLTPEYGPRVRFTSIFTTAELRSSGPRPEDLCIRCGRCTKCCPVQAIPGQDYPDGLIDKVACAHRSVELNKQFRSPCGICIKVCPVGKDRTLYNRKDVSIYDHPEKVPELQSAWKHVQAHGSGKMD